MSEQPNVDLVWNAITAFGRDDLEAVLNNFAEDVTILHPMPKEIWPWRGKSSGEKALAEGLAASSLDHSESTFFSWPGVTQYLSGETRRLLTLRPIRQHHQPRWGRTWGAS